MPLNDLMCPLCEHVEERYMKIDEVDGFSLRCPNCEDGEMHIAFLKPILGRMGGDNSDRSVSSMKRSFNERFVKKEIDEVRHKYGVLFDDSLRSGAVQRIKKELGEKA